MVDFSFNYFAFFSLSFPMFQTKPSHSLQPQGVLVCIYLTNCLLAVMDTLLLKLNVITSLINDYNARISYIFKHFSGIAWGHGNRKNQFGFKICERPVL